MKTVPCFAINDDDGDDVVDDGGDVVDDVDDVDFNPISIGSVVIS